MHSVIDVIVEHVRDLRFDLAKGVVVNPAHIAHHEKDGHCIKSKKVNGSFRTNA